MSNVKKPLPFFLNRWKKIKSEVVITSDTLISFLIFISVKISRRRKTRKRIHIKCQPWAPAHTIFCGVFISFPTDYICSLRKSIKVNFNIHYLFDSIFSNDKWINGNTVSSFGLTFAEKAQTLLSQWKLLNPNLLFKPAHLDLLSLFYEEDNLWIIYKKNTYLNKTLSLLCWPSLFYYAENLVGISYILPRI